MDQPTSPYVGRVARARVRRAELTPAPTDVVPIDAFAKAHGVCTRTVENWFDEGLPYVQVRGLRFIIVSSAAAWFAAHETTRG
jgi:hypothetical protein